mgnify:CR=1 FL=1|jgi:transcriptional regulator with XRE-family HTH domain|nr:MAG TPA: helix-turn-helix domain protein [Caudoviricetes sp.]
MKSEIAKRIDEVIKKAGGQKAISEKTGIPLKSISNYCLGISPPKLEPLIQIAEATGVSLDWLATGEGEADKTASHVTFALDMEALEAAIALTEEAAENVGAKLTPEKKAYIAAIIYEDIADTPEDQESNVDMTNVVRLVKLAV